MTTSHDTQDEENTGGMPLKTRLVFDLLCYQYIQSVKTNAPTDNQWRCQLTDKVMRMANISKKAVIAQLENLMHDSLTVVWSTWPMEMVVLSSYRIDDTGAIYFWLEKWAEDLTKRLDDTMQHIHMPAITEKDLPANP